MVLYYFAKGLVTRFVLCVCGMKLKPGGGTTIHYGTKRYSKDMAEQLVAQARQQDVVQLKPLGGSQGFNAAELLDNDVFAYENRFYLADRFLDTCFLLYANDKKGPEHGDEYDAHEFKWGSYMRNIELIADFSTDWKAQL